MARIKGIRLGMKRKSNPKDKSSSNSSDSSDVVPAGFIFLCNTKTKPRCFQYQVFGLSISQKRTVEKIMPGTKLFLFDYEMRLLHGVYEAVSQGKVELEPHAFQGKYLAQVKFRTVRECIPVQEKYFKSAILENYHAGRLRLELNEQQVNKLVPLFHPFPVPASSSSEPRELMTTLPYVASPHPSLPLRRENQYHNKNFSWLHSLQILQHQHQPTAVAVVDHHVQHHRNIHQNPIQLHDQAHSHHDLYSTRGHTLTLQEPYHPRHITGQEWLPQNHTMGLANEYHQLPLIMRQPGHVHSPHPQEPYPNWYHHQLPFLRENPTSGENLAAFATNPNSLSNVQPPLAPPYGCPELPYLVTAPYVSSTVQPLIPPTFGVLPHERTYSLPIHYVSNTMHSSSYVPASTVWPEQNYPTILPAAASYASPSGWLEPNPPISTAPNNYVTMQSHAPLSGMPLPNVPISSIFSFVGSENPFIN